MIKVTVQVDGRHRKVIFDTVEKRLGALRFDLTQEEEVKAFAELEEAIAPKLYGLEEAVRGYTTKLDEHGRALEHLNQKVDAQSTTLGVLTEKVDAIDHKLDTKVDALEKRVEVLERAAG